MKSGRLALVLALAAGCGSKKEPQPAPDLGSGTPGATATGSGSGTGATTTKPEKLDAIARMDFNKWAVRANLPVYWIEDTNENKALDPDEVASLMFYPTSGTPAAEWVKDGAFTDALYTAYAAIGAAMKAPAADPSTPEGQRQALVAQDLDQGRATLIRTRIGAFTEEEKAFVARMQKIAKLVDDLYELQNGSKALETKLPADAASRSLFRRNRGPACVGQATEGNAACSAIPGAPKPIFDLYPAALQADADFCKKLSEPKDKGLLDHFVVVRGDGADLKAVPYSEAYAEQYKAIAAELTAAAEALKDPSEAALVAYLKAAAGSFTTNDWEPANEAWAAMNVDNSKWYVRIAPDETYWEPCAEKAGLHLTFARISQASKEWQSKLVPVQQDMEQAIAERAGKPYAPRKVTFHLPDFIEIVINAGDDRDPMNITAGQSLPNWGKVADEGRGRTVAMTNVGIDRDTRDARKAAAESLIDAESMKPYASTKADPGLLNTILHEATHNLGPSHDYTVGGKNDGDIFTGPIASVLEELKAQTGALYLFDFLKTKQVLDAEYVAQGYIDGIVWCLGHISQGMYTGDKNRKTYSQLAAIQVGFLIDQGAITWDAKAKAANGTDVGAFIVHGDKLVAAIKEMMKVTAGIKARGDVKAAEALFAKYVDSSAVVPHETIRERYARIPRATYVYAIEM